MPSIQPKCFCFSIECVCLCLNAYFVISEFNSEKEWTEYDLGIIICVPSTKVNSRSSDFHSYWKMFCSSNFKRFNGANEKSDTKLKSNIEINCCQFWNDPKIAENSRMTFFHLSNRFDLVWHFLSAGCFFVYRMHQFQKIMRKFIENENTCLMLENNSVLRSINHLMEPKLYHIHWEII